MVNLGGCVDTVSNFCDLYSNAVGICGHASANEDCENSSRRSLAAFNKPEFEILEVGPYNNPFFKGENVKYFDTFSKEEIIDQILNEPDPGIRNNVGKNFDQSKVPFINFVDKSGDLTKVSGKYDIIFSSHNIEHQIDLVGHLKQVENLLKDDGRFLLIIPDKRLCFDHFIPESPLSDVLAKYIQPQKTHDLQTILAMMCEITHNDAWRHVQGKHDKIKGQDLACYQNALEVYKKANGEYINAHKWRFTPRQFNYIIASLKKMKLIDLEVEKLFLTKIGELEFYAILKKSKH